MEKDWESVKMAMHEGRCMMHVVALTSVSDLSAICQRSVRDLSCSSSARAKSSSFWVSVADVSAVMVRSTARRTAGAAGAAAARERWDSCAESGAQPQGPPGPPGPQGPRASQPEMPEMDQFYENVVLSVNMCYT